MQRLYAQIGQQVSLETKLIVLFTVLACCRLPAVAQDRRPVTVSDCVQTRRLEIGSIRISPNGALVAYVVKEPNIIANHNDYKLFVQDIAHSDPTERSRLVFQADFISGLRWLGDSKHVAVLSQSGPESQIVFIDTNSGGREVIVTSSSSQIHDYSIDARGETVAFATQVGPTSKTERRDKVHGYQVSFREGPGIHSVPRDEMTYEINLLEIRHGKKKVLKVPADEEGSISAPSANTFRFARNLSLSPNGNFLIFSYRVNCDERQLLFNRWQGNPFVELARSNLGYLEVLGLYDLHKRRLRLAIDSPHAATQATWSEDSRAYFVRTVPPVQSDYWKSSDIKSMHVVMNSRLFSKQIFTVDVESGVVTQVLPGFSREFAPLAWMRCDGELIVRSDDGTFLRLARQESGWREIGRFSVPYIAPYIYSGNDRIVVGMQEAPMVPPTIILYDIADKKTTLLTALNPQFRNITLGEAERIEWKNKYGADTTGYLIKPVGYEQGKRYPVVILAYGWSDAFICDGSGSENTTAFPPQPLANAGFLVLLANFPSEEQQPGGYPGELGEAYNFIAMIESAVELLVDRGIADRNNVGLIGWSRTSWKTDFLLTHSDLKLSAASSADGGVFNYGSYWFITDRSYQLQTEAMYGGPPYGATLSNWLQYAPPFNVQKLETPLLMEYTGSDALCAEPINAYEFFAALSRQGKAVELYFYPGGEHALDTPIERIASLQRNVDWFRFWMQGYEGKAPDYDKDQYVRWRELRELHLKSQVKKTIGSGIAQQSRAK